MDFKKEKIGSTKPAKEVKKIAKVASKKIEEKAVELKEDVKTFSFWYKFWRNARIVFVVVLFFIMSASAFGLWNPYQTLQKTGEDGGQIVSAIFSPDPSLGLQKDSYGNINFLIMGRGGKNHSGEDLTDSFMIVSLNPTQKSVSMLSLPRDLWARVPNTTDEERINRLFERGKIRHGGDETKAVEYPLAVAEKFTGIDIQYHMLLDFNAFIEIIEYLGGINIYLEQEFLDRNYPLPDFSGEEIFWLPAGANRLSGYNALKFVRSRHSTSDFSRSQRQQMVIKAIKDQVVSQNVLINSDKLAEIYQIVQNNLVTNMSLSQMIAVGKLGLEVPSENIFSAVLNNRCYMEEVCQIGSLLYNPERKYFGGASVLIPIGTTIYNLEDYSIIHNFSQIFFNNPQILQNPANIGIYYHSSARVKAYNLQNSLRPFGLNIPTLKAFESKNYEPIQSVIYVKNPSHMATANALAYLTNAKIIEGQPDVGVTLDRDADIYLMVTSDITFQKLN